MLLGKSSMVRLLKDFGTIASLPNESLSLAYTYLLGLDVEREPKTAFKYALKARDEGSVRGRVLVGFMYLNGIGTNINFSAAQDNLLIATQKFDVQAFIFLGQAYLHLSNEKYQKLAQDRLQYIKAQSTKDFCVQKALEAFQFAAKSKQLPQAHFFLGQSAELGIGTTVNMKAAASFYKDGAEAGDIPSMRRLGDFYAKGILGKPELD